MNLGCEVIKLKTSAGTLRSVFARTAGVPSLQQAPCGFCAADAASIPRPCGGWVALAGLPRSGTSLHLTEAGLAAKSATYCFFFASRHCDRKEATCRTRDDSFILWTSRFGVRLSWQHKNGAFGVRMHMNEFRGTCQKQALITPWFLFSGRKYSIARATARSCIR